MISSVLRIAVGWTPPMLEWKGSSRKPRRSSMATTTATTLPIRRAWDAAGSPLSAKNSRKTKMTTVMKKTTIHSGLGITPTAPWIRS
jgi:hypothetical protein